MSWTPGQEKARQDLITAVKEWRFAECSNPAVIKNGFRWTEGRCDGDNHQMECTIERARQDVMAAHNKVEQLKAGGS